MQFLPPLTRDPAVARREKPAGAHLPYGRHVDDVTEYYFAVKKLIDVTVSESYLDWLILRPSMLVDRAGTGAIALGPAQPHDEIPREDVAATLAELLHEPRIRRQILELNQGSTPIAAAVRANLR